MLHSTRLATVTDFESLLAEPASDGHVVRDVLPPVPDSAISVSAVGLGPASPLTIAAEGADVILYVFDGEVSATVDADRRHLQAGAAILLIDGMAATVVSDSHACLVRFRIDEKADTHAPMGAREVFAVQDFSDAASATSNRSFQVLFDPRNGSAHATLFVGIVPPGAAPWHFHQYDEVTVTLSGHGNFHQQGKVTPVQRGSVCRIPARELHINENRSASEDMMVIGLFTPAGSPSAAYLPKADQL